MTIAYEEKYKTYPHTATATNAPLPLNNAIFRMLGKLNDH